MGQDMQNDWDLGVKAACLAYNTTVHSSTGQTPFFATFGREAIMPIHWIYPIPKADRESGLSDWTETIQERFQTAYAGMSEKQAKECVEMHNITLPCGSGSLTLRLFRAVVTS